VVRLLDHVVTSGANGHKGLSLLVSVGESANGGKLCGNLIGRRGEHAAAALPIIDFLKLDTESKRTLASVCVKLLCLSSQGTTGKIAYFHFSLSPLDLAADLSTAYIFLFFLAFVWIGIEPNRLISQNLQILPKLYKLRL
jgi:hypothetical protein